MTAAITRQLRQLRVAVIDSHSLALRDAARWACRGGRAHRHRVLSVLAAALDFSVYTTPQPLAFDHCCTLLILIRERALLNHVYIMHMVTLDFVSGYHYS